ncbi:sensor histidine kinase [Dictyobacter arantiisoli]|uniref:histidine kinase n=1 Tax=Dictyobacter arantiisoli TaxID=2014874 RepID=A0A5A5TCX3_9CHLR|nr:HAMP domain-containing sensor histidine kinase [Dictyobacter arantiisoli]GCF09006.1 hypothetical protein KDI_25700 [Dictyobacter arantiisoli]
MSEQKAIRSQKQLAMRLSRADTQRLASSENLYLLGPSRGEEITQPLHMPFSQLGGNNHPDTPAWLRPFMSLRTQLTFAYSLLLILMLAFSYLLLDQQNSSTYMMLAVLALILVGSALAFVMTTLLLRPLSRMTDAAQAIAMGDLAQRTRLPLRLPPQDEIDRLAGSLNAMVSRLETAEEAQRASQDRFHQFFSDASHQLRTPLTSIRGFTELLLRGNARDDPETAQHMLRRMKNESERMTLLINDLLTLARLDDTHPMKLQYIDVVDLAVESVEQTRSRANDERPIRLHLASQDKLGVQADRECVKQLLFILLDNALKYGRPGPDGQITLKLDKIQGQVAISVTDNGDGIASDDLEHIFEAFYRGRHRSSSTSTVIGTGLGLTIASSIVRAHNGAITACSEPGNTEFKVLMPCAD